MTGGILHVVLLLGFILKSGAYCTSLRKNCGAQPYLYTTNKSAFISTSLVNPYRNHSTHHLKLYARPSQRHETYNKKDLVNEVAEKLNKTQKEVALVVDEFLATIKKHLSNNSQVTLAKFGVFKNSLRGERRMRNLQTGEIFTAKPVHVPNLKFYDTFKMEVNSKLKAKDKKNFSSYNY